MKTDTLFTDVLYLYHTISLKWNNIRADYKILVLIPFKIVSFRFNPVIPVALPAALL
jgi:hypothetical protein